MPSTRDRWHRVRTAFEELLDLSSEEQARRLEALGESQPTVAREVRALLGWHADADDFLDRPPSLTLTLGAGAGQELVGTEVGPYRLVAELGEGGMGRVFRAERTDGVYNKPVALKVLERGAENRHLVARFRAERHILAELDHPNIASLLDGGTLADGRPYFVMELVEGVPIDRFCDARRLPVADRLRLFAKVLAAVGFAHRNLVVHRDLKPGNLLVTPEGEPKLLDFGIAKLLGPGTVDLTLMPTEHGLAPLTPEYASPEQVEGRPITVLSDVYSLGVLLYQLLTGHRPYELVGRRFDELLRAISEVEPERPSLAVRRGLPRPGDEQAVEVSAVELAAARRTDPRQLARGLRGDLDTIVLVALRKEPERRYASVGELARDLDNYLEGRPVAARPDTVWYRTGKFVARHRWATGAAAAALAALMFFTGALWTQRRALLRQRTQLIAERDRAEAVSDFLTQVFSMPDPTFARGTTVTARELLDVGVASIEGNLTRQPEARSDLLFTMGRSYKNLGLYRRAEELLSQSLTARRQAGAETEIEPLAANLHELAEVAHHQARYAEAERLELEAIALLERPGAKASERLTWSLLRLARTREVLGRLSEAAPVFERALTSARGLGQPQLLAEVLTRSAGFKRRLGAWQDAEREYREALELERKLGPNHPDLALTQNDLAMLLIDRGRFAEAESLLGAAEALQRKVYDRAHPHLAITLNNLGLLRLQQNRLEEARQLFEQAIAQFQTALGPGHPEEANSRINLGDVYAVLGQNAKAEATYREALELRRKALPAGHPDVADALNSLARIYVAQGRASEAEPLYREALAMTRETLGPRSSKVGVILSNLGELKHRQGDLAGARELFEESLAIARATQAKPVDLGGALNNLGFIERQAGNDAQAEQRFREALDLLSANLEPNHLNLAMVRLSLASVLTARGKGAEAVALAGRAFDVLSDVLAKDDPWVRAAHQVLGEALLAEKRFGEAEGHLMAVAPAPAKKAPSRTEIKTLKLLARLYRESSRSELALEVEQRLARLPG